MKSYPNYKPSGVEWLGDIPDYWEMKKLKYELKSLNKYRVPLSSPERGAMKKRKYDYYGASGVIDKVDNYIFDEPLLLIAEDGANLLMRNLPLAIIATGKYWVNNHAHILKPYQGDLHFFAHLLETMRYDDYISGSAQPKLTQERLANIEIPVPPTKEQTAIANFLDCKSEQIDRFITNKEKLVELLKEQKTAIINKAVTKGIDPDVKLKSSDIEWLGDIPEHWEVKKLKYVSKINPGKDNSRYNKNSKELVTFLPMEQVSEDGIISNKIKKTISELWEGFTYFARNDVILAKITPCFENGKGAFLDKLETEIGFGTTEFHVLRANKNINPEFLHFLLKSSAFMTLGEKNMAGAGGQKRVPTSFVANYSFGLPPLLEQSDIADYIKTQISKIDAAITQAEKEIKLIKEYRQALIANAVTGKIDVRDEVHPDASNNVDLAQAFRPV